MMLGKEQYQMQDKRRTHGEEVALHKKYMRRLIAGTAAVALFCGVVIGVATMSSTRGRAIMRPVLGKRVCGLRGNAFVAYDANKASLPVKGGVSLLHRHWQPAKMNVDSTGPGRQRTKIRVCLQHIGIDIRAKPGTKVYAIADGRVVESRPAGSWDGLIVIQHYSSKTRRTFYSIYGSGMRRMVKRGHYVHRGQQIGEVQAKRTNHETRRRVKGHVPHLHFAMYTGPERSQWPGFYEGEIVCGKKEWWPDPLQFIKGINEKR